MTIPQQPGQPQSGNYGYQNQSPSGYGQPAGTPQNGYQGQAPGYANQAPNGYPSYNGYNGSYPGLSAPGSGKGLGVTSVIIAVTLTVLTPFINYLVNRMIITSSGSYVDYGWVQLSINLVTLVIAVGGLILGTLATKRSTKTLGGIGVGGNGLLILSTLFAYLAQYTVYALPY